MGKQKVLISDSFSEAGLGILKKENDLEVVYTGGMDRETMLKEVADADGLIIRSASKVDKEVIAAAKKLKVVIRAGVGVDNIDIPEASNNGVIVMNAPGGNSVSTAEQALALMFAAARNTARANEGMHQGKWEKKKLKGVQLTGKTLAVLGLGRIGREVVKRAKGLQMNVIGYDPFIPAEKLAHLEIDIRGLDEIWPVADFITVHTPLTDSTRDLVNKDVISKLKKNCILINAARGGIYNEADLADALKEGKIKGAGVDVFTREPIAEDNPLVGVPTAVLTPHLGASTSEAEELVAVETASSMVQFLTTGVARNSLNFPTIDPTEMSFLEPYFQLGERLGLVGAQLLGAPVENLHIEYVGPISEYNISPITTACLKGVLKVSSGNEVNIVNAPYLAKERGLVPVEAKASESRDYQNTIVVKLSGGQQSIRLQGIILGGEPWVVKIDDFRTLFKPKGHLLVIHNKDVPGVVSYVGTFLSNNDLNIANMDLARGKGEALTIIALDTSLPREKAAELAASEIIITARTINLDG